MRSAADSPWRLPARHPRTPGSISNRPFYEGIKLAGDGVAAQTRQVFANLGKVLEAVGASFSNVVEFTTYLVGKESVQPFIKARTEIFPGIFPDGDFPPNTLLIIDGLVRSEFLVEIKAVAVLA